MKKKSEMKTYKLIVTCDRKFNVLSEELIESKESIDYGPLVDA